MSLSLQGMENRLRIKELQSQKDAEINKISNAYKELIGPLYTKITLKDLKENGWVYDCYYPAGNEDYYKKGDTGNLIRVKIVDKEIRWLLTNKPAYNRYPCDLEDLEYYNKTGK